MYQNCSLLCNHQTRGFFLHCLDCGFKQSFFGLLSLFSFALASSWREGVSRRNVTLLVNEHANITWNIKTKK
jgi:hypothetical protein